MQVDEQPRVGAKPLHDGDETGVQVAATAQPMLGRDATAAS
jgi:hypothetical protein